MRVEDGLVYCMNNNYSSSMDDDDGSRINSKFSGSLSCRSSREQLVGCGVSDLGGGEHFQNHRYSFDIFDEGCFGGDSSPMDLLPQAPLRRIKSTSNLLQIPAVSRSRKASDDSAVGSAEDSDVSDKSDQNLSESSSNEAPDMVCATSVPPPRSQPTARPVSLPPSSTVLRRQSATSISPTARSSLVRAAAVDKSARGSSASCDSRKSSVTSLELNRQLSSPTPPVAAEYRPVVCRSASEDVTASEAAGLSKPFLDTSSRGLELLRPPSVVVSDHDLSPSVDRYLTLDDLDADYGLSNYRRRLSDCSTCSTLSLNEPEYYISTLPSDEAADEESGAVKKVSAWRRIRTIVHQVTPFIQTYKRNRYLWVQLAGHQGSFKAGDKAGTIKKKYCEREKESLDLLMTDALRPFVPNYFGCDNEGYLELEDLLAKFHNPCVMDCKIGVRTYLEEELIKAKEKPKLRKDMYEKMCQIDPNAPTEEEHQLRGVTKPRYMVWRETISATSTLGFRIEGVRHSDGTSTKDFKTTKLEAEVKTAFKTFTTGQKGTVRKFLDRLSQLREALSQSQFFQTHEVIGSSLLFVHDQKEAGIWMIDFAKTVPLPPGVGPLRHDIPWTVGNHEDGYLVGINHLTKILEELRDEC